MTWYAAHLIEYFRLREGHQEKYPVWESVILIQANSVGEALDLAHQIGKEKYDATDDTWHLDDQPATKIFLGIRKIVECDLDDADSSPALGTEITYTKMEVNTEDEARRMAHGESVTVTMEEVGRATRPDANS
ncbi:MAG: DUF4288 domain-containing protein [Anaerolinea sp.]|nr:DUF4288 domain-containing protein [Anaerolinea sp.]CAG0990796.1 hypothetical protein ANRL4_02457 [Anaerolineae bacterium]